MTLRRLATVVKIHLILGCGLLTLGLMELPSMSTGKDLTNIGLLVIAAGPFVTSLLYLLTGIQRKLLLVIFLVWGILGLTIASYYW